ncbi:hypothetical protein AYI69_g8542 [Smittium culicis]|uniref:Uncharacterized protein n=1 Tax=Smittium culicis TaxID=133412 RepID=A0A1R1XIW5_9FUNG|nr:hypothetical protein AYI69_g8542 [Smittium culicis]
MYKLRRSMCGKLLNLDLSKTFWFDGQIEAPQTGSNGAAGNKHDLVAHLLERADNFDNSEERGQQRHVAVRIAHGTRPELKHDRKMALVAIVRVQDIRRAARSADTARRFARYIAGNRFGAMEGRSRHVRCWTRLARA